MIRRRREDFATLAIAAGVVVWVVLDLGPLAVALAGILVILLLQIPGQLAHNAERTAVIAEYERIKGDLPDAERRSRLSTIRRTYGSRHPAVKRLVAEESSTINHR